MRVWIGVLLIGSIIAIVMATNRAPDGRAGRRARASVVPGETLAPPVEQAEQKHPSLEDRIREIEESEEAEDATNRVATVRTESGDPIVNAAFQFGGRVFTTDARGRVEFLWPDEERTLEFDVRHPGYIDLLEERKDTGKELEFVLRSGHTIRGVVVFPSGSPLPEARVGAWSDESTDRPACFTGENGRFEFTGVPDHAVTVAVAGLDVSRSWSPGDPPLRLIVPHSRILLRIAGSDGRPVRNARVRLFWIEPDRHAFSKEIEVGPRAVYRAHREERRSAKIMVLADGYRARAVTVPPASGAPALWEKRIELIPFESVPIFLHAHRGDGTPARFVIVAVLDEDGDIARQIHAHPTRDEPARIDGVAPGAIRIRVWEQGSELLFRELTVDAGGQTVNVELPDGAWLTVANPPHMVGPMGLVVRRIDDGLTVGMRSFGKQGFYRSPSRLPPGRYRAEVVQYGGRVPGTRRLLPSKVIRRKEFEVRPGKDVTIGWEGTKVAR